MTHRISYVTMRFFLFAAYGVILESSGEEKGEDSGNGKRNKKKKEEDTAAV